MTMRPPPGEKDGADSAAGQWVTRRWRVPSARIVQTFWFWSMYADPRMKASLRPSADQEG
jgi:hypothetical protein